MANIILHKAATRGHADRGWLNARHSFSFAGYYDPERVHFGVLRVLNDDIVAPGRGFGTHPHDNMEIISIPIKGAIEHRDSTGRHEIIRSGDVQLMSAGSGIQHSEYNPSSTEILNLLQIWLFPKLENVKPRYEQKTFESADRLNKFQLVVSPVENDGAVTINQDAWFSLATITKETTLRYDLQKKDNGIYLFVIKGSVNVDGNTLQSRDAIGITEVQNIHIKAEEDAEILVMDIPMI